MHNPIYLSGSGLNCYANDVATFGVRDSLTAANKLRCETLIILDGAKATPPCSLPHQKALPGRQ